MKYYYNIIENVTDNELYYNGVEMIYDTNKYDDDEIDGTVEYGTWIPEW